MFPNTIFIYLHHLSYRHRRKNTGYPLLTHSQLSVKHRQMVFPINMRQLTGQRHILRTTLVTL